MNADLSILEALDRRLEVAEPDWQWCLQDDESPVLSTQPVSRVPAPSPGALDVLIIGDLFEDLAGEADMTKAELSEALRRGRMDSVLRRHVVLQRARVGGFVARAARVTRALSCRIRPACVVPSPLPLSLATFFQDVEADMRFVVAQPGPTPVRYRIRCRDGTVLLRRSGIQRLAAPPVPRRALQRLHAVLVDPADRSERGRVLSMLGGVVRPSRRRATVAISGSGDWRWRDLQAARDCGGWLFFNAQELIRTARRVTAAYSVVRPRPCPCVLRKRLGCCRLVASLGLCLRDNIGMCRVVTGLGACGATLLNGDGPLKYFPTVPLLPRRAKGAGEILMVVTALSSAGGASDEISVRRGVRAATGCVAGLPLPLTLDELDI